jgi:hypothetical protein
LELEMTQDTLFTLILIAAVFLAGTSMGQLMLRIRLARLERLNMRLDQRRLNALARAWESRAVAYRSEDAAFTSDVRDEIETILTEIESA